MDTQECFERLIRAGRRAHECAAGIVAQELPQELCFTFPASGDPCGRQGPPGTIKYRGGRLLKPEELCCVTARRASALLWVDGKIPRWINLSVERCDATITELLVLSSPDLVPAELANLPPYYGMPRETISCPFACAAQHFRKVGDQLLPMGACGCHTPGMRMNFEAWLRTPILLVLGGGERMIMTP